MPHRKLGRPTGHRLSMLRTMVSQLVKHERIETTVAKGTDSAKSFARGILRGDDVIHKVFTEFAYRYRNRAGGYTRLLRTRIRQGDAAEMAYIEYVDRDNELREAKPAAKPPKRLPLDPWTKSRLSKQWPPRENVSTQAKPTVSPPERPH
ncbi:uncharacterized protein LOC131078852 isoform X2 [Cryptomeria japonica]|uniref:uncharacterized protein LOC131078852 isoform X2 n=1 Tax=Cryptomeria japonica TaxID=3369 RepID=UPI0025AD0436|nr:uncharacterized protein LOC131078852 isoform X2 [Cryptomeria japonica]